MSLAWSDPVSRMRVSLGAVPGSVPPRGPFPGAAGHPRTAETTCPSAEHSQGCARAEQSQDRQDGVTSGHGAGLPLLPAEGGMGVSPFFLLLFSIFAVWKRGAELSPAPLHKLNKGQGLLPGFELSVPGAGNVPACVYPWVFTRVGSHLLPAPVLGTGWDQSLCLCCQLAFCAQPGCSV